MCMKILDLKSVLLAQKLFGRTPSGRSITDYAKDTIRATLDDEKNWDMEATKCLNCCFIASSLLFENGCPNCGGHDLTLDINEEDVII